MSKKSAIKQKMLQYVKQLGMSENEFSNKSDITRGVLKSDTGITEENIAKFLAYDESIQEGRRVSLDWLLRDEGPMFEDFDPENVVNDPKSYYGYRRKVRNLDQLVDHLSTMTDMFGETLKETSSTLKNIQDEN